MAFRLAARFVGSGSAKTIAAAGTLPPRRLFTFGRRVGGSFIATTAAAACGAVVAFAAYKRAVTAAPPAVSTAAAANAGAEPAQRGLNWRERRFLAHASLQYDGIAYLSPLDFLESVALPIDEDAAGDSSAASLVPLHSRKPKSKKRHKRRRVLAEADYRAMIRSTPGKRRASDHLFRDIGANGLISYPEFLLLLNLLSKSNYGFQVAFRAFDRNCDGRIDVEEFRRLYRVVSGSEAPDSCSSELLSYASGPTAPTTSLLVHFFGTDCRDTLSAVDFAKFADNLQREVLLVEYLTGCSQTAATMSPVDFGQAVLRRTRLNSAERRLRLSLLEDRVWQSDGVTVEEYRQFFQFLLHTDDLFFALRMFDIAGKSIDQEDFQRAVKAVTGQTVSPKLLTIVFALFDINGDGALSYGEFLSLFGHQDSALKYQGSLAGREADETAGQQYKKCIKKYMHQQQ